MTSAAPREEPGTRRPRTLQRRRAAGFVVALLLTVLLALEGGGYDVVVRHQVAIAVWALIALGLASGLLPRSRLTPHAWLALGGLTALAVLTLLSHAWTESDERTTAETARVLQYLGVVTLAYMALNRYTWQGAAAGFAAGAVIVPFLAVGSRLFPDLLADEVARTLQIDRLSYPLDYWNGVSCWGAMAIGVGLCVSAHAPRLALRSLALAAIPVAATSVYLTYSRFGVAAALIALLAAFAVSKHRWTVALNATAAAAASAVAILVVRGQDEIARATGSGGTGTVVLVLIIVALGCAGAAVLTAGVGADRLRMPVRLARLSLVVSALSVVIAAAALHGPIEDAWREFRNEKAVASGSDPAQRLTSFGGTRHAVWSTALDAFQTDPMRGIGPGSFELYWSREGEGTEFLRDAHSLYFEEAAELGIPGLLAVLAALTGLLLAAIAARQRWSRERELAVGTALIAAFAVFLAYAAVDWMWELGAVGTLALGGAAVAGAGGLERTRRWDLGPWLRAGAVLIALAAGMIQVPTLVSVERTRASEAALARGDLAEARELADEAIEAESWAASPYAMRALVSEADGELEQARRDIDEAIEREPTNWRHQLILARIDARAGDRQAVASDLAEAKRLAPRSLFLSEGSPYRLGLEQLLGVPRPGSG
jgi:tetratricopeptide (TPR) repeat protein